MASVPMITGTSRAMTDSYCSSPKPWMSNTVSINIEPPMNTVTRSPRLVAMGIIELRKAWPNTALRKPAPFATAVRT